jgi:hypothetical protein
MKSRTLIRQVFITRADRVRPLFDGATWEYENNNDSELSLFFAFGV